MRRIQEVFGCPQRTCCELVSGYEQEIDGLQQELQDREASFDEASQLKSMLQLCEAASFSSRNLLDSSCKRYLRFCFVSVPKTSILSRAQNNEAKVAGQCRLGTSWNLSLSPLPISLPPCSLSLPEFLDKALFKHLMPCFHAGQQAAALL